MPHTLPIAIYYEQPNWFKPLFAEFDRCGTPYIKLFASDHFYSPEDHPEEKYSLVFNLTQRSEARGYDLAAAY